MPPQTSQKQNQGMDPNQAAASLAFVTQLSQKMQTVQQSKNPSTTPANQQPINDTQDLQSQDIQTQLADFKDGILKEIEGLKKEIKKDSSSQAIESLRKELEQLIKEQ